MPKASDMILTRIFPGDEFRADTGENGQLRIGGYAATFNSETVIGNYFREVILPGAFTKTLQESDVRALFNHNNDYVLGRKKNGTLRLREDERGLPFECDLPDTQFARDLHTSIKRGDIDAMSFRFRVIKETWTESPDLDGLALRELVEVHLIEVSPVTFPAYEATEVEARAIVDDAMQRQLLRTPEPEVREDTHSPEPQENPLKLWEMRLQLLEKTIK